MRRLLPVCPRAKRLANKQHESVDSPTGVQRGFCRVVAPLSVFAGCRHATTAPLSVFAGCRHATTAPLSVFAGCNLTIKHKGGIKWVLKILKNVVASVIRIAIFVMRIHVVSHVRIAKKASRNSYTKSTKKLARTEILPMLFSCKKQRDNNLRKLRSGQIIGRSIFLYSSC